MEKNWYASKTLWVNAIAIIAMVVQELTGKEVLDIGTQGVLLGVVNLILRLVTKDEVVW